MLQRRSKRPPAIDASAVALLVDATPVLNKYDVAEQLSRMSYVTGRECGKVRLAEREVINGVGAEQVRRVGLYDPKNMEMDPLFGNQSHGESSAEVARLPARFMLVPQDDNG